MMAVIDGKAADEPAVSLFDGKGEAADAQRQQMRSISVTETLRPPHDHFGIFVDGVAAVRCVHPAVVSVEALIDEELSPRRGAVDVEPLFTGHLQLGTEIKGGVRIDPQQSVSGSAAAGCDREAVGAAEREWRASRGAVRRAEGR